MTTAGLTNRQTNAPKTLAGSTASTRAIPSFSDSAPSVTSPSSDGRHVHHLRQSDLKTFFMCPQLSLLKRQGLRDPGSDSTVMGTALHTGIQVVLDDIIESDGAPLSVSDMIDVFDMELDDLWLPDLPVRKRTIKGARIFGRAACAAWHEEVLPTLRPLATEHTFSVLFYQDDERVIYLDGTWDYLDEAGLKDWKTASRPYEKWEKERFDIQSTTYTYAAWRDGEFGGESIAVPFEFVIHLAKGNIQRLTVYRGMRHWNWLRAQCVSIARLIEADLPAWPLNDQGWWCSEKWCPAWMECKGKFLEGES